MKPEDAPVEWELFKEYNKRDVEVERAIAEWLKNHPVPQSVWEEYWLDQEINDRGILIDVDMVEKALQLDAQAQEHLTAEIKKLTGVENPRSVVQMKSWLSENGMWDGLTASPEHIVWVDAETKMTLAEAKREQRPLLTSNYPYKLF